MRKHREQAPAIRKSVSVGSVFDSAMRLRKFRAVFSFCSEPALQHRITRIWKTGWQTFSFNGLPVRPSSTNRDHSEKRGQDLQEQATMIPGYAVLIFLVNISSRHSRPLWRRNEFGRDALQRHGAHFEVQSHSVRSRSGFRHRTGWIRIPSSINLPKFGGRLIHRPLTLSRCARTERPQKGRIDLLCWPQMKYTRNRMISHLGVRERSLETRIWQCFAAKS